MTWADFVKQAYRSARDWGVQPSEFWALSPREWWWEADDKIRQAKAMRIGMGGHSELEWEEARKRHREKMKAKHG